MSRLDILKASLEKKEAKFNNMLDNHFNDVKSANGQPLNDKRNGRQTFNRWEKQNNSLCNQKKEIEKTENAIWHEENKAINIEIAKNNFPKEIQSLIDGGTLKQWGKHPYILFVDGVDKARIGWDVKKKTVYHKFTNEITDKEQYKKFAKIYNEIFNAINKNKAR